MNASTFTLKLASRLNQLLFASLCFLVNFSNAQTSEKCPAGDTSIFATSPCFLAISDIHLNVDKNLKTPDTDEDLWNAAKTEICKVLLTDTGYSKPKFVIVLGDLPRHKLKTDEDDYLEKSIRPAIKKVLADLKAITDSANIPLLYVPGNNDSWTGDYKYFSEEIFTASPVWNDGKPMTTAGTGHPHIINYNKMGWYSAYPMGEKARFRVIAMNTVLFSHKHKKAENLKGEEEIDSIAKLELNWLATQLRDARKKKEYVLIAIHIPPGTDGFIEDKLKPGEHKPEWYEKLMPYGTGADVETVFLNLLGDYRDVVVGVLAGHSHFDGIRKLYANGKGDSALVLISIPGITTNHGNNPGMKLVYYNRKNFELQDFKTWYYTYTSAHPEWEAFTFRAAYKCYCPVSIYSYINDSRNNNTLEQGVNSTYYLFSGKGAADNDPGSTINVGGK